MVSGTRVLKYWVLGPSGSHTFQGFRGPGASKPAAPKSRLVPQGTGGASEARRAGPNEWGVCCLGVLWNLNPRAPSIKMLPIVGPTVYRYDILWAIWSPMGIKVPILWSRIPDLQYSCSILNLQMYFNILQVSLGRRGCGLLGGRCMNIFIIVYSAF